MDPGFRMASKEGRKEGKGSSFFTYVRSPVPIAE